MIRKYWYQKKFKLDSDEDILSEAWKKRYIPFFNSVLKLKENDDNIYEKIKEFNKWSSIIPTNEELNKVILSKELIKTIFEEYHFAKLTEKSSAKKIIKNIYNAFFGKKIIESKLDLNKTNVKFIISDTTRIMYEFGLRKLKTNHIKSDNEEDPFINETNIIKIDTIDEDEEEEEIILITKKPEPINNRHFFTVDFNED